MLILTIVTINLTTLRISIKNSVIQTTFKPYIRRYLQRLNKKQKTNYIVTIRKRNQTLLDLKL